MLIKNNYSRDKPEYPEKTSIWRKSLTNFFTLCCIEYTSAGFELASLVVIITDFTDYKQQYDHDNDSSNVIRM